MHCVGDLFVCLDIINGHVGRLIDVYGGLLGGCCVDQKNLEGERTVSNTWFKREKMMKVTFRLGENETEYGFL